MNEDQAKAEVVKYWMEKAGEALTSARSEEEAGRLHFAINRAYYACFYSASAVLLKQGEKFSKHAGVRAAVHRSLVKAGKLDAERGRFYDLIFNSRQRGDYLEMVEFRPEEAKELIAQSEDFVSVMERLLENQE